MPKSIATNTIAADSSSSTAQQVIDFNVLVSLNALRFIDKEVKFSEIGTVNVNDCDAFPAKSWFLGQALSQARRVITALALFKVGYEFEGELKNYIGYLDVDSMQRDNAGQQVRKLKEFLVRLILFQSTNEEAYFHHYILIEEYQSKEKTVCDFAKEYEIQCRHLEAQQKELSSSLDVIESRLNTSRVWYEPKRANGVGGRRLKSEKSLMKSALNVASDIDRMVLGYMHRTYGLDSAKIHANFGVTATRLVDGENADTAQLLGLLVMRVLLKVSELLSLQSHCELQILRDYCDSAAFHEIAKVRMGANLKVGDVVEVFAHLGTIENIKKGSSFGSAVLVDFSGNPIVRGVNKDWYVGFFVHRVMSKEEFERLIWKRVRKLLPVKKISLGRVQAKAKNILGRIRFNSSAELDIVGGSESSWPTLFAR